MGDEIGQKRQADCMATTLPKINQPGPESLSYLEFSSYLCACLALASPAHRLL